MPNIGHSVEHYRTYFLRVKSCHYNVVIVLAETDEDAGKETVRQETMPPCKVAGDRGTSHKSTFTLEIIQIIEGTLVPNERCAILAGIDGGPVEIVEIFSF